MSLANALSVAGLQLTRRQIWKGIKVPLGQRKVSKQEGQELLHAVEELYFYRRYGEAVAFIGRVFEGAGEAVGVDRDVRYLLGAYERKCLAKMDKTVAKLEYLDVQCIQSFTVTKNRLGRSPKS